jgi:hypothetical protein
MICRFQSDRIENEEPELISHDPERRFRTAQVLVQIILENEEPIRRYLVSFTYWAIFG